MHQLLLINNFSTLLNEFNDFLSFLKNISITPYDVVDIILLSFIFASFVFFVKEKKIRSAIIGMGIFYAAIFIVSIFDLPGTKIISTSLLEVGILIFVILFHAEIRDVFEKLGVNIRLKLFNKENRDSSKLPSYEIIDNVCSAVRELSATKTGALIVIARTTQLDDISNTGVKINADVNSYLLRNIFYDKAPLHDGAVIIDEGRIACAGCILPLTRRKDFEGDLGTRHKAAIGLSEISDAIIIVISEETGIISVAMDYSLTREYTPDGLRKFLFNNILHDSNIE